MALTGTYFGRRRRQLGKVVARAKGWLGVFEVIFAIGDLLGVFDLYAAITNAVNPATRRLTESEKHLLQPIFGNSVPWELIRIDERAWVGPRWANICYVSFHTINSWGPMSPNILVHEVVHIWQYTQVGAAYIPRALAAQRSAMGYNYGGIGPLERGKALAAFNYEQQADIIEDAYRLANGYHAQWHGFGPEVLPVYYPYLREVLGGE